AGTSRSVGTAQEIARSGVLTLRWGRGAQTRPSPRAGAGTPQTRLRPFLSAVQDSRESGVLASDGWIPRSPVSPAQRGAGQTASPSPRRRHRPAFYAA